MNQEIEVKHLEESALNFQSGSHILHGRKMHKIDICAVQIVKTKLGAEKCRPEDNLHRRNTTSPPIWSTSVEKAIYKASYKSKLIGVRRLKSI